MNNILFKIDQQVAPGVDNYLGVVVKYRSIAFV
jgi:hypothetical protein